MERRKLYSSQPSNSTFQPQSMRRSSLEQVNPGRGEMHSSSTPINAGDSTRERTMHPVKAGDTPWEIAENKQGSGNRWQELQKKDGGGFPKQAARRLSIGTSVDTLEAQSHPARSIASKHSLAARRQLQANTSQANQPLVGIIDRGFGAGEHGTEVLETISSVNAQAPTWLGQGVGNGGWAESLTEFVDTAKASGQKRAVANLSFDLTEQHPDGRISTRSQLTAEEQQALTYARDNGVLIVASAGNQGGAMSALGQASQQFDNIIAVGAAEGTNRASYSSYGNGLDLVAPGSQQGDAFTGTSRATAEVTGAISQMWAANPTLDYRQVTRALESTATDLQKPGWDTQTGAGLLNTTAAVNLARTITPETQVFSGAQLIQQVDGSFNNSTWKSTDGAVASERVNMLAPIEGSGSSGKKKPKSKPKPSKESSHSSDRQLQAAYQQEHYYGTMYQHSKSKESGAGSGSKEDKEATGKKSSGKASATSKSRQSNHSSQSPSHASEIELADAAKRKAAHLESPSKEDKKATGEKSSGRAAEIDRIEAAKQNASRKGFSLGPPPNEDKKAKDAERLRKAAYQQERYYQTFRVGKSTHKAPAPKQSDGFLPSLGDKLDDAADAIDDVGNWVMKKAKAYSDEGHTALDMAGMVPLFATANFLNASWYAATGDFQNTLLSIVPGAGNFAKVYEWGKGKWKASDNSGSPPNRPSKSELDDAARRAEAARDSLEKTKKTLAKAEDNERILSGWKDDPRRQNLVEQVESFMYKYDIEFMDSGAFDDGFGGKFKASHAERMAFMEEWLQNPDKPVLAIGVNRKLCSDGNGGKKGPLAASCQAFFQDAANATGKTIVIADYDRKGNKRTQFFSPE